MPCGPGMVGRVTPSGTRSAHAAPAPRRRAWLLAGALLAILGLALLA